MNTTATPTAAGETTVSLAGPKAQPGHHAKGSGGHYDAVRKLQAQGMSKAAIGRKLGLHHATVRKFAAAASIDDLIARTQQRTHLVDPYTGHLHQRWHEGERNATQLCTTPSRRWPPSPPTCAAATTPSPQG